MPDPKTQRSAMCSITATNGGRVANVHFNDVQTNADQLFDITADTGGEVEGISASKVRPPALAELTQLRTEMARLAETDEHRAAVQAAERLEAAVRRGETGNLGALVQGVGLWGLKVASDLSIKFTAEFLAAWLKRPV